ncbi:MAG: phosphoadenylyl-sulfate reductase [Aquamicrobium sp.]|nr:phosphoadenylyl-sulfate reductase [Aquamicrobium sp.]
MHEIDSWPPGGDDALLSKLADRYIGPGNLLDLAGVLLDPAVGKLALVSSFGAESAVLIHLVLAVAPETDVVFVDTGKHFDETYDYVNVLTHSVPIRNLKVAKPDQRLLAVEDSDGDLYKSNPDSCCTIRKTFALQDLLVEYDGWLTGRKRFQSGSRTTLPYFERDGAHLKVNPLILWDPDTLEAYFLRHDLPRHPLVARGYPSIGCQPCTRAVAPGESQRAGRWSGVDKVECGIHLGPDGTFTRTVEKHRRR